MARPPTIERDASIEANRRREGAVGDVFFHAPSQAFQAPGGGENQLIQTKRALEALGIPVRLFSPWTDRFRQARLLHLFGMSREGLELARVSKALGTPVALSPICWIEPRAMSSGGRLRTAWNLAKWGFKSLAPRWPTWRGDLLDLADVVLPNSRVEADQLRRYFGVDPAKIHVVPNGVAPDFAEADPEEFRRAFGDEDFVLFTGRLEPRKNPLGVIRAASELGYPTVVIGGSVPGHEAYARECLRAGRGNVNFLGSIDPDSSLLRSSYAAARVFALASRFETPGLAALEAGLAGTAVVVTPVGATREYFGDRVEYARADRPRELREALERAWNEGPRPGLRDRILSKYLWSDVAEQTAEAYAKVTR